MHITLSPIHSGAPLVLEVVGDVLTGNGVALDLSAIPEGATLPLEAVTGWPWLASDVTRIDGELHLTLQLPIAADAPQASRFPDPIHVTTDGPVLLPPHSAEEAA